ncbi:MAG: S-ribosylhomocysteine lyase [Muribaculaceae bacterium]|nr:S-ribosylhomocysteine lyase [Muribaculaceae bacterium]
MDKIASFTIDHERLLRGIYVSRQDKTPSGDSLTTFDIRLTEPNRMPPVKPETLHTIEHLAATYLRNHPRWKERVVYWGPMGCCTGCYLILQGNLSSQDILPLIDETFRFISGFEGEIPGASSKDCGNWRFNDLEDAKRVAAKFLEEVITNITSSNLNYPKPL